MRGLKFSTVANASGFAILVKGQGRAVDDAIEAAYDRLERVCGARYGGDMATHESLPRTGDNIAVRITWQAHAHA